jgi:predicted HTH domain antitoxin
MSNAETHSNVNLSPEESIREINQERTRRSRVAIALFAVSAVVFGSIVYMAAQDTPEAALPAASEP